MIAVLAAASALADERVAWELLQDAFLDESADGDLDAAASQYEMLVRTLAADDPVRSEALYHLGRVRFIRGDIRGARESLDAAARIAGPVRARALDFLTEIDVQSFGFQALPVSWTFDDPAIVGIVHPRLLADIGSVSVIASAFGVPDPALLWKTAADPRVEDRLVIGVRVDAAGLDVVRFRARGHVATVRLAVDLIDDLGRTWVAPTEGGGIAVPADDWTQIEVRTVDLKALGGLSGVDRIVLRKVSSAGGDVVIDNIEAE